MSVDLNRENVVASSVSVPPTGLPVVVATFSTPVPVGSFTFQCTFPAGGSLNGGMFQVNWSLDGTNWSSAGISYGSNANPSGSGTVFVPASRRFQVLAINGGTVATSVTTSVLVEHS